MRLSDYDFDLPADSIAQEAVEPRDQARLLRHAVDEDRTEHSHVCDLPEILEPGDLLVLNDTRVRPARVFANRTSGGRVEFLFLEPASGEGAAAWQTLVRPARKLRAGECLEVQGADLKIRALARGVDEEGQPSALWSVELLDALGHALDEPGVEAACERMGRMPLPPYIRREGDGDSRHSTDRDRYQTVYAREPGAVAAPTAGLHFTSELLERLEARGVHLASITLHVGLGTFLPVTVEDPSEHPMHAEWYRVPDETVAAVEACRDRGGRVVAVGTTSVRALESCATGGSLKAGEGLTRLFLHPGCQLQCVDGLLTNFHLPRSTLLMLVSALAGRERMLELYAEAIEEGYRFYSYGDAMLLLP
ncbi:MAG: tRNA preQ1(34) S-adenosylmethionine ribosyltransferase-isomerase QueA [Planctomycetota bacterium]|nr:tRNA preQ1(34) S-adenosylmethionine ribosyltransferase-isomerase QueA [Planctomycetota bacterium]